MSKGLNAYIVKDARRMAAAGMSVAEIGAQLGVESARLADAIRGVTYGHMKHPPAVAVGGGSREVREPGARGDVWLLDPGSVRALRSERLGLSQRQFAELIQRVCVYLGYDGVRCSKRLVQKWESGEHAMPLGHYRQALAFVAGESIERVRAFMPSGELGNPADRLLGILARHDRLRTEAQSIHDALVSVYVELANESRGVVADEPGPGQVAGAGADAAEDQ
jgi:transcriptional regulator with XRE-family HTH domain